MNTTSSVLKGPPEPMYLNGGGGVRLAVTRRGSPEGTPLIFLHGFCQSHRAFDKQLTSSLLQKHDLWALDLRGHGMSEKPCDAESYQTPKLWADDLAAVLAAAGNRPAIVVAWSYAGYILADYIGTHGSALIGGINLVGGAVKKDPTLADAVGAAFKSHVADLCSDDLLRSLRGVRKLTIECTHLPVSSEDTELFHMVACMTPHYVRKAMLARTVDQDSHLQSLKSPVLLSHGIHDSVILPTMVGVTKGLLPQSVASWYDCGHSPFLEMPDRFNHELDRFIALECA